MARKFFVGGNFKMNGTEESIKAIVENLNKADLDPNTEIVIAPPALFHLTARDALTTKAVSLSAQNTFTKNSGAWTGEIGPEMLKKAGIPWVIIGHSERRNTPHLKESDSFLAEKTVIALETGLSVIFCIGETKAQKDKGEKVRDEVLAVQLGAVGDALKDKVHLWRNVVIAYEPVWAIGTGDFASCDDVQTIHHKLRLWLSKHVSQDVAEATRILYGGSVTAANCKETVVQPDVDGFLVGGASLKPEFVNICNSQREVRKE